MKWQNLDKLSCAYKQITLLRKFSSYKSGILFESVTVQCLQQYSFDITHCGKRGDRGVDFRGVWRLGSRSVPIVGQCKHFRGGRTRVGPVLLRELEGVLSHEHDDSLAILCTNTGFTNMAYQHFMSSTYPMVLLVLGDRTTRDTNTPCSILDTKSSPNSKPDEINDKKELGDVSMMFHCHQTQERICDKHDEYAKDKKAVDNDCKDFEHWKPTMFEMNRAARTLVPGVIVGQTLSRGTREINLLLLENNKYRQILNI